MMPAVLAKCMQAYPRHEVFIISSGLSCSYSVMALTSRFFPLWSHITLRFVRLW